MTCRKMVWSSLIDLDAMEQAEGASVDDGDGRTMAGAGAGAGAKKKKAASGSPLLAAMHDCMHRGGVRRLQRVSAEAEAAGRKGGDGDVSGAKGGGAVSVVEDFDFGNDDSSSSPFGLGIGFGDDGGAGMKSSPATPGGLMPFHDHHEQQLN